MDLLSTLLAEANPPRSGLMPLDYVAVGFYLLITAGIVVWASFRQKDTEEFFLAGRRMPWLAVGMSLMATLLSTNSYLAVPGETIKNGITFMFGYLSIPFSMTVIMVFWVPFFMRLRMTSAYEYLESRFDCRVRLLAGFLFFLLRLGWISVVVYTASLALSRMIDVNIYWVIASVGIAATIFACMGGIDAVIWNDVLQFFMLFGGTGVTIFYVWWATGQGPSAWWANIKAHTPGHTDPILFSLNPAERITIVTAMLSTFFWTICTHGSDQVVLQRYFTTTSLTAARRSYLVNAVSDLAIGFLLTLSGVALHSFYINHAHFLPTDLNPQKGDELLPYFFAHQLPVGFGGLILAGFLCDAMQTLESGVNSITAVATRDVFERLFPEGRKYLSSLMLARIVTVGMGLLVTGMASAVTWYKAERPNLNILDLMPKVFNLHLGPLAALFFIGMFLPRCRARSAISGTIAGVSVAITWNWWHEICLFASRHLADSSRWEYLATKTPTFTMAVALPCVTSFVTAWLFGLIFDGGDHPGRQYSWRAVMQRPAEPVPPVTEA